MFPSYAQTKADLLNGCICLHYQPIVSLETREILGYEALARWGQVSAPNIARIVESHNLHQTWIRQQIAQIDLVLQRIYPPVWVSLNISQAMLKLPALPVLLSTSPNKLGLQIEVLESVRLTPEAAAMLRQLKSHHILKADDVGSTDYSWMSRIIGQHADLFHELKLCKGLTRDVLRDKRTAIACRHIITLAVELGLSVVAEWVESDRQADLLRSWGCHAGQGRLFGMAKPPEDIP